MSDQIITILKLCLVGLLYLFFLRVLWAVWTEVREPVTVGAGGRPAPAAEATSRGGRRRRAPVLVARAPGALLGQAWELSGELTIGRAPGCHVRIDDSFASNLHARVRVEGNQVMVDDLGSTNGTFVNEQKVAGPVALRRGDRIRTGETVLELT